VILKKTSVTALIAVASIAGTVFATPTSAFAASTSSSLPDSQNLMTAQQEQQAEQKQANMMAEYGGVLSGSTSNSLSPMSLPVIHLVQ